MVLVSVCTCMCLFMYESGKELPMPKTTDKRPKKSRGRWKGI